jgi:hypothetical protein
VVTRTATTHFSLFGFLYLLKEKKWEHGSSCSRTHMTWTKEQQNNLKKINPVMMKDEVSDVGWTEKNIHRICIFSASIDNVHELISQSPQFRCSSWLGLPDICEFFLIWIMFCPNQCRIIKFVTNGLRDNYIHVLLSTIWRNAFHPKIPTVKLWYVVLISKPFNHCWGDIRHIIQWIKIFNTLYQDNGQLYQYRRTRSINTFCWRTWLRPLIESFYPCEAWKEKLNLVVKAG